MEVAAEVMVESVTVMPQSEQRERKLAHEYRAADNRRNEK
jgi:hypothetical protein